METHSQPLEDPRESPVGEPAESGSIMKDTPEIRNELGELCVYEKICVYRSVFVYKCGKCTKLYSTIESLKNHLNFCSMSPKFSCEHCEYKTHHKIKLKIHLRCHNQLSVSEDKDNEIRLTNTGYKRRLYRCESCDYRSHREELLEYHVKKVHPSSDLHLELPLATPYRYKFFCKKCDFKTYREDYLELHLNAKHSLKPPIISKKPVKKKKVVRKQIFKFFCDKCRFKTEKKVYIERHIQLKHTQTELNKAKLQPRLMSRPADLEVEFQIQNISCKHCEFKTHDDKVLYWHMRYYHPELFTCKKCGRVFARPWCVTTHLVNRRCKG